MSDDNVLDQEIARVARLTDQLLAPAHGPPNNEIMRALQELRKRRAELEPIDAIADAIPACLT
jgi:hypothetical protein